MLGTRRFHKAVKCTVLFTRLLIAASRQSTVEQTGEIARNATKRNNVEGNRNDTEVITRLHALDEEAIRIRKQK